MDESADEGRTSVEWAVTFYPDPSEIKLHGFDTILTKIADVVFDAESAFTMLWGSDALVSGHLDRAVTVTLYPAAEVMVTLARFQDSVAEMVAELGLQGYVRAERIIGVTSGE